MNVKEFIEMLSWYPGEAKIDISSIMVLSPEDFADMKARYGKSASADNPCPPPPHMKILPTDLQLTGLAFDPLHRRVRLLTLAPNELLEQINLPEWSPEIQDEMEERLDEGSGSDSSPV